MNVFEEFLGQLLFGGSSEAHGVIGTRQKFTLWGAALILFVACGWILSFFGLPAIPHISSLLTHGQPFYAIVIVGIVYVLAAIIARPTVGGIRPDAALFCAAIAMLALPTRGGDIRNALLDSGSPSVFIAMTIELIVLSGFVLLASLISRPKPIVTGTAQADSTNDRLTVVGVQALAMLILLSLIGQSPLKGQSITCAAAAGLIATLIVHQSYRVTGSICYLAGTLLAGVVAYVWSYFNHAALPLGDTSGLLAGAARSLPLHYATAGVAGTIYGYWISGSWIAPKDSPTVTVGEAAVIVAMSAASSI